MFNGQKYQIETGGGPLVVRVQARRTSNWRIVVVDPAGGSVVLSTWTQVVFSFRLRPFDSALFAQRVASLVGVGGATVNVLFPKSTWDGIPWDYSMRERTIWMDVLLNGVTEQFALEDVQGNRVFPVRVASSILGLP